MLIQWRATSQCSVSMFSPSSGPRVGSLAGCASIAVNYMEVLLHFLRPSMYHWRMNSADPQEDRPDIVAATRGGDNSLGMESEGDPASATLEQALFWRNIYSEILTMEEAVLERIHELMGGQSVQARQRSS